MNFETFVAEVNGLAVDAAGAVEQFGRNELVPGLIRAAEVVEQFGRNQAGPALGRAAPVLL